MRAEETSQVYNTCFRLPAMGVALCEDKVKGMSTGRHRRSFRQSTALISIRAIRVSTLSFPPPPRYLIFNTLRLSEAPLTTALLSSVL